MASMGPQRRRSLQLENLEDRRVLAQVLPDLFAWEGNSNNYLHDYRVEGDLLRFSTALANQGQGPLEIRGGAALPNGNQEVFQRIYNDDGTFEDVLAGEFTYHPTHGHIHFDGYAIYNLRSRLPDGTAGDVVSTGGKVSFCLIDITPLPGTTNSSSYGSCGSTRQGISAGWSDVYSSGLSDQWVNIATIPDGDYILEVTVDPDNQLVESNELNNTTMIDVTIDRGGNGGGGDVFEPNNAFSTAADLGIVSYRNEPGLSIHTATDEDFFEIEAADGGNFSAEILFTDSLGDLDLYVYDASQQLVTSSTTSSDLEQVTWPVSLGEKFYVRVVGVDSGTNGYDLELDGPGNISTVSVVSDDANLPRSIPDSPGPAITSTLVGPDIALSDVNLALNSLTHTYVGDLDITITSPAGTVARILESAFDSPQGFLGSENNFTNTIIDDQSPNFLGNASAPFTGTFNVDHPSVGINPLSVFNGENAAGTWTITIEDQASSDTGSLNAWGLQFSGVVSPDGDRFELNDDFAQAVDLGSIGTAHEEQLSIHNTLDVDYFRFTAANEGDATIDILFEHAVGDLELVVYDQTLTEIGRSASSSDNESVTVPVTNSSLYYVEVLGVAGATNSSYTLNANVSTALPGDLNGDGVVDATDVDQLCAALAANSTDPRYDLNGDGSVGAADGEELVFNIMGMLPGDANFDGLVDTSDFNIWNNHKFSSGCYTEGDFNFDGLIDTSDFNMWNVNKFTSLRPIGLEMPMTAKSAVEVEAAATVEAAMNVVALPRLASLTDRAGFQDGRDRSGRSDVPSVRDLAFAEWSSNVSRF